MRSTGSRLCPYSVKEYSTLGGTSAYTLRSTSWSSSSSRSWLVSIFCVIWGMSFFSSLKRLVPSRPRCHRMISFHLPPMTARVSSFSQLISFRLMRSLISVANVCVPLSFLHIILQNTRPPHMPPLPSTFFIYKETASLSLRSLPCLCCYSLTRLPCRLAALKSGCASMLVSPAAFAFSSAAL
ncbi:hypothetical protein D3C73_1281790 [compost metagenome]